MGVALGCGVGEPTIICSTDDEVNVAAVEIVRVEVEEDTAVTVVPLVMPVPETVLPTVMPDVELTVTVVDDVVEVVTVTETTDSV